MVLKMPGPMTFLIITSDYGMMLTLSKNCNTSITNVIIMIKFQYLQVVQTLSEIVTWLHRHKCHSHQDSMSAGSWSAADPQRGPWLHHHQCHSMAKVQCQQALGVLQTLSEGLGSIITNVIPWPRFSVNRLLECCRPTARALNPSALMPLSLIFSICRLLQCCRPSAKALAPSSPMPFWPRFKVCRLLQYCRPSAKALAPISTNAIPVKDSVSAGSWSAADPQRGPWLHQHQYHCDSRFSVCRFLECCRPSARALAPSAPMPIPFKIQCLQAHLQCFTVSTRASL